MNQLDVRTIAATAAIGIASFAATYGGYLLFDQNRSVRQSDITTHIEEFVPSNNQTTTDTPTPSSTDAPVNLVQPQNAMSITIPTHMYQTFNNCGPATLSMYLSHLGTNKPQAELGNILRPYQNPQGDNDDKSVTLEELADQAEEYGYVSYHRPNATVDLVKKFIANDIPVIARTWLHPNEDIGHYRVIRGYNDTEQTFLQDDSYEGPNLTYSYSAFLDMWQPFNYEYLVIVPQEKTRVAETILGEETDNITVWQNALARAQQEAQQNSQNAYPVFNQSVAQFHLGSYEESITLYERSRGGLPGRMLWYQIEPIQAHAKLGHVDQVFAMTNAILNNGNRAFSELYQLRGEVLMKNGRQAEARQEFEKALQYNQNYEPAQAALEQLGE